MKKYKLSRSLAGWLGAAIVVGVPLRSAAEEIPVLRGREHSYSGKCGDVFTLSLVPQPGAKPVIIYHQLEKPEHEQDCGENCEHSFWTISADGKKLYMFGEDEPKPLVSFVDVELEDFNLDGVIDLRMYEREIGGMGHLLRNYVYLIWKMDQFVWWEEAEVLGANAYLDGNRIYSYCPSRYVGCSSYSIFEVKNGKFLPLEKKYGVQFAHLPPGSKKYPKLNSDFIYIIEHYRNGKLIKRVATQDYKT